MTRIRRTVCPFETAPRDGTPFHILNTIRFNPLMARFEALSHHEDEPSEKRVWRPISFHCGPSVWLRMVPLPYEIPDGQFFPVSWTATYMVRRKTRWARLRDGVANALDRFARWVLPTSPDPVTLRWTEAAKWEAVPASGIEAAAADETPLGGSAVGESPTGEAGDAQTPPPINPLREGETE